MKTILSYGAGKDSTALVAINENRDASAKYLEITREALDAAFPVFDLAVFSDTGAEFGVTYETLEKVRAILGERFVRVAKDGETIEEWCLRLGIVPVMPGGSHVCSRKYKGDVMDKWAREQGFQTPTWILGIEANEGRRVKRFTAPKDGATYLYPLVELDLTREKLDDLLAFLGWDKVHKSSCVFCPFMSEPELREMFENHPIEWAKAVAIEARFQEMSFAKNQLWLNSGRPLNKGGRAPRGMWRLNSWEQGARLFVKKIDGKMLSVQEWAARFQAEKSNRIPTTSAES